MQSHDLLFISVRRVICPEGVDYAGSTEEVAYASATGGQWGCDGRAHGCSTAHTAYDSILRMLSPPCDLWHPIALAGGGNSTSTIQIASTDNYVKLHYADLGVPDGAEPLRIVLTPDQPITLVQPLQSIGGPARFYDGISLNVVTFGGQQQNPWAVARFSISTPWAPTKTNAESQNLLVSAMSAYADQDWTRAAIDTQSAIDRGLQEQTDSLLKSVTSPRWRPQFRLDQRLVLLELLAGTKGLPQLSPETRGHVASLKDLRNKKAAHGGEQLTHEELAPVLAGAVAALWWIWLTGPKLST